MIDWGVVIAVLMLVAWAVGTALEWGGWVHGLLTIGLFLLVWRVVGKNGKGAASGGRRSS